MKIAFIGQKGIPVKNGGVERRVEELSVRMAKMGHEVFVYVRNDYTPKKLSKFKKVSLIHIPFIPTKNLGAISHSFLATIHALFQDFDVIHYQAPGPSSLCWITKILKPQTVLVATFNSRDSQHQKWGNIAKKYLNFGEWVISNLPDKTIVVSKVLRDYVKEKFGKDAVVIHNGSFVKKTYNCSEIEKWDLKEKKYFLSVSRLINHKGIHYLIKAFINGQKNEKIPKDYKLVIVGEGSYTEKYVNRLKRLAGKNKNVVLTGNLVGDSLSQLYFHAYAFVQPSEAEGLSNSLLEAMGYGIAPIVSDIPENVLPVGENGLIFRNKDVENLEEKLTFAARSSSLIRKMGESAKANIETNYNWNENAQRTVKLYEELILKKKGYFGRLLSERSV